MLTCLIIATQLVASGPNESTALQATYGPCGGYMQAVDVPTQQERAADNKRMAEMKAKGIGE